jgi:hypothetical protein
MYSPKYGRGHLGLKVIPKLASSKIINGRCKSVREVSHEGDLVSAGRVARVDPSRLLASSMTYSFK